MFIRALCSAHCYLSLCLEPCPENSRLVVQIISIQQLPWTILYADDLVIIAETLEELVSKLKLWKERLEARGMLVNMGKMKIMFSSRELNSLHDWKTSQWCLQEGSGEQLNFL